MFQLVWAACSMQCAALVIPNKNSNHSNQTRLPFQFFCVKVKNIFWRTFLSVPGIFPILLKDFQSIKKTNSSYLLMENIWETPCKLFIVLFVF